MKRKLFALLTVLALLFSLCPAALAAAEGEVRETNFFTDENAGRRTDMTFEEVAEYVLDWYDNEFDYWDYCIPLAHEILELAQDEANAGQVRDMLLELNEAYLKCSAGSQIGYIRYYQTYEDYYWNDYYNGCFYGYYNLWYLLAGLSGKILDTPCAGVVEELIASEANREDDRLNADWYLDISYYTYYYPLETEDETEEMPEDGDEAPGEDYVDPYDANDALLSEYNSKYYDTFTVTYEGREWDEDELYDALLAEEIDNGTYTRLVREIGKVRNEALGGLFVESLPYKQQIAENYGYSNYMEYSYEYDYLRDFTYEDIQAYADALKAYIVPVYQQIQDIPYERTGAFYADYAGEIGMDLIQPYLGRMSSELLESFTYMREHGMVDSGWSDTKQLSSNFTSTLYGFGTGYVLCDPAIAYSTNQIYNFEMIVHEYGHYNAAYWNDNSSGFFGPGDKTIDIMEVQSQGLELLMLEYYPDIFGIESRGVILDKLSGVPYTLLYEAQCNEFETYAYTTPGVTLQQLNEKWLQLGIEYGFVDPDTTNTENYNWVTNPQLFNSPGYSISYSVSLAGACAFWLNAQEDFFTGVDEYLEYCALPNELAFQESFASMGIDNPLSPDYIQALGEELAAVVSRYDVSFSDVEGQWYTQAVLALAAKGLVEGYDDGSFRPEDPAVLGMIDAGSDRADETLTRLEACRLLAQQLELELDSTAVSAFPDTDSSVIAALAQLGVISGYPDGTFQPDQAMTRAELCIVWYLMLSV